MCVNMEKISSEEVFFHFFGKIGKISDRCIELSKQKMRQLLTPGKNQYFKKKKKSLLGSAVIIVTQS